MLSVRDPLLQKTLAACFKKTLTYFRSDLPMKTALTMSALETFLLHAEGVNPKRSPRLLDPRIQEISQFIRVQYREDLTVAVLARRCRLSPSRFAHLFKEEMGQSPNQFVERQRMERAIELLTLTREPVAAIAYDVGYDNPLYFSQRFNHFTGLGPRAYRDRKQPV